MSTSGFFIAFEGGEGSGKSYHAARLADVLKQRGHDVVLTHEPGATAVGATIRQLLLDARADDHAPLAATTELFLFLADRAQHVHEIIAPALAQGKTVICDRFVGSTLAYQGGGRTLVEDNLLPAMNMLATGGRMPNVVVYLDVDPRIGLARKGRQHGHALNRLEREDMAFHDRVRTAFQQLATHHEHWVTIDAQQPIKNVEQDILNILQNHRL